MKQRGYILVARGLLKHPRFKPSGPFTALEAWLWLIEEAAFEGRTVSVRSGNRKGTIQLEAASCRIQSDFWPKPEAGATSACNGFCATSFPIIQRPRKRLRKRLRFKR
jgi:hypothetical protein